MGVFNGNSIYNDGGAGGGGGYNDGGQIVDADFMKIENNAVSTYDNINRNTLNFYLDPSEGEILNAVVELKTAVNSVVNVYVFKNGLYYLLGNIGGDTVAAGNEYKVIILGNSYEVENISSIPDGPKFFKLNNGFVTPLTFICSYDSKKWYCTGNLGNYLNYNQQEKIVDNNPLLTLGSSDLFSFIRDNVPDPKLKFGINEYPGSKYYGSGPYDEGNDFYFFTTSLSRGRKFTVDDNTLKDAPGWANGGNQYSTILFYSE